MTATICRAHIGDLRLDADDAIAPGLLCSIVAQLGDRAVADRIDLPVRDTRDIPRRRLPAARGQGCHAIGALPVAGIEGRQPGPNKTGGGW